MDFKDASPDISAIAQNYSYEAPPSWLVKVQEIVREVLLAIEQWFNRLFRINSPGPADSKAISTVMQVWIYIAGFAALLAIIYFIWRRAKKNAEEQAATKRGATSVEDILDSQGYMNEAAKLAEKQDFRGGCRSLYLAFLRLMDERKVAAFAPAKTNYEYRYVLANYAKLQNGFKDLAETVELVWFGNKEADASDYESCLSIIRGLTPEIHRIGDEKAKIVAGLESADVG